MLVQPEDRTEVIALDSALALAMGGLSIGILIGAYMQYRVESPSKDNKENRHEQ